MRNIDEIVKALSKLIKKQKTQGYDTTATVIKTEGNVAWIHIPGGVDQTPCEKTIECSTGDTVQVRVAGGKAWITGNRTAPPTDDKTANEAKSVAGKAHTAAAEAQDTAETAQAAAGRAEHIAADTNQHFWHTEEGTDTGAHITEKTQDEFLNDPQHGGGNLLARSNGIAVRDGLTELATFDKDGLTINDSHGANVARVLRDDFELKTSTGVKIFQVKPISGQTATISVGQNVYGETYLEYTPNLPIDLQLYWSDGQDHDSTGISITEPGTVSVFTGKAYETQVTYSVSGRHKIMISSPDVSGTANYEVTTPVPCFTLGTRKGDPGPFSGVIGESLIQDAQGLAIGRFNEDRDEPVYLAVGDGTSDGDRHNALTIYKDESKYGSYAEFTGSISAPVAYFEHVATDTANVGGYTCEWQSHLLHSRDVTTGFMLSTSKYYTFGPIVTVKITVKSLDGETTAGGNDIFKGYLDVPKPPIYLATGSYYGQYAIGASLDVDGKLVVRNATNRTLGDMGQNNSVTVSFTYIRNKINA